MVELQQLQQQLGEAIGRIHLLEERLRSLEEASRWKHLIARPHQWRRQLSLRARNMTVGQLVSTIRANKLSPEAASDDLELPLEAIREALAYYEENKALIQREANEERRWLAEQGYPL